MALVGGLYYEKLRAIFGEHFSEGGYLGSFGSESNSFDVVPDPLHAHRIVGRQLEGNKTLRGIHGYRFDTAHSFEFGVEPGDAGNAIHPLDGHFNREELSLCGQANPKDQSQNLHKSILT